MMLVRQYNFDISGGAGVDFGIVEAQFDVFQKGVSWGVNSYFFLIDAVF